MKIQKHHIRNVLKTYCRQLTRQEGNSRMTESRPNAFCLSPLQKRQVIIDQVTRSIKAKMNELGADPCTGQGARRNPDSESKSDQKNASPASGYFIRRTPIRFVYDTIDAHNHNETHTLLVDDDTFLVKS